MKKGEIKIGEWHFKFGIVPIYWRPRGYMFHFGVFKVLDYPPEGQMITKAEYKGFWIRKEFDQWNGFEINF